MLKNIYFSSNIGSYLFYIGLFLLPSAFSFAAILLLISLIISTFSYEENSQKDYCNIFFLFGSALMILSSIIHSLYANNYYSDYNPKLSWIGLLNWIPFFWVYWGFKPYCNSPEKRRRVSLILLSGSLPVLVTGLGQSFFDWNGPFQFLNGLIVWYQRPIDSITGLTGLFNNPNYAGTWLNIVWPFCISALLYKSNYFLKDIPIYLFTFGISLSTILTNSRAAWIGIILGSLLMLGKKSFKFTRNIIIIIALIISSTIYPILGLNIQKFFTNFIPESILLEFSNFQFSRIEIWKSGLITVINSPIFGTGAGSFPEIFESQTGLWKGHSHNLPLELMISYGIPTALLILFPILLITYLATRKIFFLRNQKEFMIFDKSWITALIILLISQMVDVQYFDGRISIILWILLSGTKNIYEDRSITGFKEIKNLKKNNKVK